MRRKTKRLKQCRNTSDSTHKSSQPTSRFRLSPVLRTRSADSSSDNAETDKIWYLPAYLRYRMLFPSKPADRSQSPAHIQGKYTTAAHFLLSSFFCEKKYIPKARDKKLSAQSLYSSKNTQKYRDFPERLSPQLSAAFSQSTETYRTRMRVKLHRKYVIHSDAYIPKNFVSHSPALPYCVPA